MTTRSPKVWEIGRTSIGSLLICLAVPSCVTAEVQPAVPAKKSLGGVLWDIALKYDCYFTLEERVESESSPCKVDEEKILPLPDGLSQKQALAHLEKQLPGYFIQPGRPNRAVIHLVDKKLASTKGYALDQKISITYDGLLYDLPDEILKKVPNFRKRYAYATGGDWMYFAKTPARLKVTDLPVRRIVTDYVPLSQHNRIIWGAGTAMYDGKPGTCIQYYGLASRPNPRDPTSDDIEKNAAGDFSRGETAFESTPGSFDGVPEKEYVTKALRFIEQRMKSGNTTQVRWAMFYLGKCKCAEAVPLLLKHIDYQYTECGLIEESYPAYGALASIGKPASQVTLTQLRMETTGRRSELLAKLLAAVEGAKESRNLLMKELGKTSDPAVKRRLQDALKKLGEGHLAE